MPKAWVWANWINPLKYGIEATIMNEFIGKEERRGRGEEKRGEEKRRREEEKKEKRVRRK